jgi:capsule polysaccharide modification protein KpsS
MHLDRMQHALLLQGPVGPFFRRFAEDLRRRGTRVTKVNFNAGDALFFRGKDVIAYDGKLDAWPAAFRKLVAERQIDAVFVFGDQRAIHAPVIAIAKELGIAVWAFEEGYLRPDYVTLERDGVNGNSTMPRDASIYRAAVLPPITEPLAIGNTFGRHTFWTILHSIVLTFGFWLYPRYRHHRNSGTFYNAFCWTRGGFRKLKYKIKERGFVARLVEEYDGRYFVLPLQVHCDSQITHSDYASMEEFIDETVRTFAAAAPADHLLVVKHHPHDTPYRDYTKLLRQLGAKYGCADRVRYCHDLHLPTLLKHARGVVTMNSTVGISALHHRAPVKVMGRAVYDVPGLTSTRTLARFFAEPGKVDHELYERFVAWLRAHNQINGSFYKRIAALGTVSGLDPATFAAQPREPAVVSDELISHDSLRP